MNAKQVAVAVGAVIVVAVAFFLGIQVGDDSAQVTKANADVAAISAQRDSETKRAAELARQLDQQDVDLQKLEDQLSKSPASSEPEDSASKAVEVSAHGLGRPASAGQMTLTPVSFSRLSEAGDTATYQAVVSVKNNGSAGISPFCGGSGAIVLDSKSRSFDGDSSIGSDSSNCGDDVQPGLTAGNFKMMFKMPADAKPKILKLWGETGNEENAQLWHVK